MMRNSGRASRCSPERIRTVVCPDDVSACRQVAAILADVIRRKAGDGQRAVLGLATGSTPIGVYRELVRMHREQALDFSNVVTFNLDEYYPMKKNSLQSYHLWMHENFFRHVNIPPRNIHIPDGTVPRSRIDSHCRQYERLIRRAGGIDVQLLGIGRTGHIGFNEPGSARDSRTRLVRLDDVTRKDAAADFFGEDNVPAEAITMGVGTILQARKIILMAFGEHKAAIIRRAVEEPVSEAVAASYLQQHPDAVVYLDRAAAGELTSQKTPWLVREVRWSDRLAKRAVVWLSLKTSKSILKLEQHDYDRNQLHSLLRQRGPLDALNRRIFHDLQKRIWPACDFIRRGQRVVIFSPHPDDDVISMGGTMRKLLAAGNDVHVAYQTPGNIAVFDHDVIRYCDFVREFNVQFGLESRRSADLKRQVTEFLRRKRPAAVDIPEVLAIKRLIRESEARSACKHLGIPARNVSFLNMPFYQTGRVQKQPITEEDVKIIVNYLRRLRPEKMFMAGDLSDPHGTHRMCAQAVLQALQVLPPSVRPKEIWLYRGAWQEWEPQDIDVAVPMTRKELQIKIFGIFKHQSQKDKALFPGPYDDREFWQRAEERNRHTARVFDTLGLPEYYAMESFVKLRDLSTLQP